MILSYHSGLGYNDLRQDKNKRHFIRNKHTTASYSTPWNSSEEDSEVSVVMWSSWTLIPISPIITFPCLTCFQSHSSVSSVFKKTSNQSIFPAKFHVRVILLFCPSRYDSSIRDLKSFVSLVVLLTQKAYTCFGLRVLTEGTDWSTRSLANPQLSHIMLVLFDLCLCELGL